MQLIKAKMNQVLGIREQLFLRPLGLGLLAAGVGVRL